MPAQTARQGSSSTTGRVKGLLAAKSRARALKKAQITMRRSKLQSPEMSQLFSMPPLPAGRQAALPCLPSSAPTDFTCMAKSIKLKL